MKKSDTGSFQIGSDFQNGRNRSAPSFVIKTEALGKIHGNLSLSDLIPSLARVFNPQPKTFKGLRDLIEAAPKVGKKLTSLTPKVSIAFRLLAASKLDFNPEELPARVCGLSQGLSLETVKSPDSLDQKAFQIRKVKADETILALSLLFRLPPGFCPPSNKSLDDFLDSETIGRALDSQKRDPLKAAQVTKNEASRAEVLLAELGVDTSGPLDARDPRVAERLGIIFAKETFVNEVSGTNLARTDISFSNIETIEDYATALARVFGEEINSNNELAEKINALSQSAKYQLFEMLREVPEHNPRLRIMLQMANSLGINIFSDSDSTLNRKSLVTLFHGLTDAKIQELSSLALMYSGAEDDTSGLLPGADARCDKVVVATEQLSYHPIERFGALEILVEKLKEEAGGNPDPSSIEKQVLDLISLINSWSFSMTQIPEIVSKISVGAEEVDLGEFLKKFSSFDSMFG